MIFDRDRLAALLASREAPGVRLALLFGSRGRGTATPGSDIDLALLCTRAMSGAERLDLIGDIGALFGLPVDLIDLHHAPYPVTGEALGGDRLIGDAETFATLATRHLTDREDFGPLHDRAIDAKLDRWLRR